MDTRQIEYILKIAEENNITHAANKLFITQSALNQQLIKLEQELGHSPVPPFPHQLASDGGRGNLHPECQGNYEAEAGNLPDHPRPV